MKDNTFLQLENIWYTTSGLNKIDKKQRFQERAFKQGYTQKEIVNFYTKKRIRGSYIFLG